MMRYNVAMMDMMMCMSMGMCMLCRANHPIHSAIISA